MTMHQTTRQSIFMLAMLFPLISWAQEMKSSGRSAEEIVPAKWSHTEATGDLNKDGIADLAIIVTSYFKEYIEVDENGDTIDNNPSSLYLYKGGPDGSYQLWKVYEGAVPNSPTRFCIIDQSVDITDRGTLIISTSTFLTAGGWGNSDDSYVFRYQQGEFCLIGEEHHEMARNTGEDTTTSINHLTHKKWVSTSNAFDDTVKEKKVWKNIPKAPLRVLGKDITVIGDE